MINLILLFLILVPVILPPYDHGVSAFAACGTNAVCIEFTYIESYEKDLELILTDFLNGCHFDAD